MCNVYRRIDEVRHRGSFSWSRRRRIKNRTKNIWFSKTARTVAGVGARPLCSTVSWLQLNLIQLAYDDPRTVASSHQLLFCMLASRYKCNIRSKTSNNFVHDKTSSVALSIATLTLTADTMHNADYVVARCHSVCLSHAGITSKRLNISSNFFHCRVATLFQFFRHHTLWQYSNWDHVTGASNARVWKISDFRQISRFRNDTR